MVRSKSLIFLSIALCADAAIAQSTETSDLVTKLSQITSCYSPSFSADGTEIAFVSNITGTPQVWRVSALGGWPIQVTSLADTVSFATWSPDGKWLAVSAAPGGGMNSQAYLVSPDGLEVKRITPGGKETNRMGDWSHDGQLLALGSNSRSPAAMDAYLYNLSSGKAQLVAKNNGIGSIVDLDESSEKALLTRLAGRGSNDLYLRDLATKEEILLTPHEGPGSFAGELAKDGKTVYMASNKDRDMIGFGRLTIADGRASEIKILRGRDDAELSSMALNPEESRIALVWNVAGRSELEVLDLNTGKVHAVDLSADIIGGLDWSHDGNRLALVASSANATSNIFVLDTTNGQSHQVTFSPHPGVDLDRLVRPELIRYPSHDGLELSGWLYRPPGSGDTPEPYVLSFHGGPEGQERPSLRANYQALLVQGIGVFAPNIRGSSGFGKNFVNLDNRELRFDANKDIEATARYLVETGIADRARLGIMGGSYGGYAVMVAVTEYPDLFSAGVNLFGMVNFETFFEHTEPWMAAISGTEYGDPKTQKDLLRKLSPIHKLDGVRTPLLVLHGKNDTNVPVVEAEQVVDNLKARNVPVKYILFPDEGHGFRKAKNRLTTTVETVDWFVTYLKAEGG